MNPPDPESLREAVRSNYAAAVQPHPAPGPDSDEAPAASCCAPTGCCGGAERGELAGLADPEALARSLGYDPADLILLPPEANLGLSCGNPGGIAALRPGETVLDLGSGAGFDAFLAGPKIGAAGHVIGVDMTPEMLAAARAKLPAYRERTGLANVEFRLGEIEHLPIADHSVDVVLSNCVLNLSPDKAQVWREIARVLRPGGRVAISDLALLQPLPEAIASDVEALVGCIAGAPLLTEVRTWVEQAGLAPLQVEAQPQAVEAMYPHGSPLRDRLEEALPPGHSLADYLVSAAFSTHAPQE